MISKSGDYVNHICNVRFRVEGSGNFKSTLFSLSGVKNQPLADTIMKTSDSNLPTRLANFKSQKTQVDIRTTEINEYFSIDSITVFTRPYATGYPQNNQ